MKNIIEKFDYSLLLLLVGFVFVLSGFYEIENLRDLRIDKLENPDELPLILGILFISLSLGLYIFSVKSGAIAKENITERAEATSERRFANLIYIYARDKDAIAMGYHTKHNVLLPPGTRLAVSEMPHEHLLDIVKLQIGLKVDYQDFFWLRPAREYIVTNASGQSIGKTVICPSPVWAQLEAHDQRRDQRNKSAVKEHFDFVFLCVLDKAVELKGGRRRKSDWYTYSEVEEMVSDQNSDHRTFVDVFEGFKEIRKIVNSMRESAAKIA